MPLPGLLGPVAQDSAIAAAVRAARAGDRPRLDLTAPPGLRPFALAAVARQADRPLLAVTATGREADDLAAGVRTLLGSEAPADLDVDAEPLEPLEVPKRPVTHYEEAARLNRPEVLALGFAARAKHALSLLEQRREYPDVALVATGSYAYAPSVDSPVNAFANNPFNGLGFGLAATLRMPLDLGPRFARTDRARAEADETELRRREALGGIALEVRKAFDEMTEAQARVAAVQKGEKAGKAWVAAVTQNFSVGLAEARDLSDALLQYFKMRGFALQATFDVNVAAVTLARVSGGELAPPEKAPAAVSAR